MLTPESQMWLAQEPDSYKEKTFPLESEQHYHHRHSSHLSSFTLMKLTTHLVLTATGSIHSPVQFWVAGRPHGAPQGAAHALESRNSYSIMTLWMFFLYASISTRASIRPTQTELYKKHSWFPTQMFSTLAKSCTWSWVESCNFCSDFTLCWYPNFDSI